jgi:hypothetical protein
MSPQPIINRIILYSLLISNSNISNRDGTGWYNPTNNTIFKTKEAAESIRGKLSLSLASEESNILLGHVRAASIIGGKRLISDEKAHPFVSKNFILMHNGGLEKKTYQYSKDEVDMIDSEIFLKELEKDYEKETDFVKCINTTMSRFQGKFAFMIVHKNDIFVIRGKTADLYVADIALGGELIGKIVNTSDVSADKILADITYFYNLWGADLQFTKFVLLDKESIYKVTDFNLEKISEIKENDKPVYNYQAYNANYRTITSRTKVAVNAITVTNLLHYISELGLTIEELDKLFEISTAGAGILQCEETDLVDIWPVLMELEKRNNSNKKIRKQWTDLQNMFSSRPTELYNLLGLQFPYFLQPDLKKIIAEEEVKQKNANKTTSVILL